MYSKQKTFEIVLDHILSRVDLPSTPLEYRACTDRKMAESVLQVVSYLMRSTDQSTNFHARKPCGSH